MRDRTPIDREQSEILSFTYQTGTMPPGHYLVTLRTFNQTTYTARRYYDGHQFPCPSVDPDVTVDRIWRAL